MAVLVALYVLSAVLPIIGFGRLLWRAQRDLNEARRLSAERGSPGYTFDEFDAAWGDRVAAPLATRNALVWDISLVGVGLLAGAAASIASLFL
ncbi:hypothetical protein PUW79_02625 [Microbacterium sp. NE2HP2]|uniref:hypothetical protein n=1 Tax=Microbacterium plantarum TaxID=1816425 RepID=UPI002365FFE5|nr:hypothetical protein [Microbacterium plantarum]MDD7943519.1 hypothetical protein [Microbacterium plantarum]